MYDTSIPSSSRGHRPTISNYIFIAVWLGILVALFRFPYWFVDVINWDESTFAIVGKAILNGQILYVDIWDVKPPLAFVQIAIFQWMIDETIWAIRLGGAFYVWLSAGLVFLIVNEIQDRRAALLSAMVTVPMMSLYWGGQATMTEHLAVVPLLLATWLMIAHPVINGRIAFMVGVFISIAAMSRLNLAYVAFPAGLLVVAFGSNASWFERIQKGLIFSFGGLLPVFIVIAYFAFQGSLDDFYKSVILAPLFYSGQSSGLLSALIAMIRHMMHPAEFPWIDLKVIVIALAVLGALATIVMALRRKIPLRPILILFVMATAVMFTILVSGKHHSHYLLQISPFFAIFLAGVFSMLGKQRALKTTVAVTVAIIITLSWYTGPRHQWLTIWTLYSESKNLEQGVSYQLADRIDNEKLTDYTLYAMSAHLTYFLLNKYPLTLMSTHPSNITKPYLIKALYGAEATPMDELERVLSQKPTFIITRKDNWYLRKYPKLERRLELELAEYDLIDQIGERALYRRVVR